MPVILGASLPEQVKEEPEGTTSPGSTERQLDWKVVLVVNSTLETVGKPGIERVQALADISRSACCQQ